MIKIFGKDYITVAERLKLAEKDIKEIHTEVLFQEPVVVRATVYLKDGRIATGISAANPTKMIEKSSPYEVAETSALGRALGFLGYGIVDGIATADEMAKASNVEPKKDIVGDDPDWVKSFDVATSIRKCKIHNVSLLRALSKTKVTKEGKPLPYWYHPVANGGMCFGNE